MPILFFMLLFGFLHAQNSDQLVRTSLKNHPSLHAIQHRLDAMDIAIMRSQKWANPDISLSLVDIQLGDPFDRSLEPMQYQSVDMKQKFPWFGKLKALKTVKESQKKVLFDSYEIAENQLALSVKIASYTLLEIKARLAITRRYQKLITQNMALYDAYTSTDTQSHSSSVSSALMLSSLLIRTQRYRAIQTVQEAKLAYLVQQKKPIIKEKLTLKRPKKLGYYLSQIEHNPTYRQKRTQKRVASNTKILQDLNQMPDPYVKVGYFNRSAFEDYGSISVGISLPLYGSEKLDSQIAQKEILASQSEAIDTKALVESQIYATYASLNEAYHIYTIIQNKSLPQLKHRFELSQASLQNGQDLITYTTLLEQKLTLEEQAIATQGDYFRHLATLNSLIGKY